MLDACARARTRTQRQTQRRRGDHTFGLFTSNLFTFLVANAKLALVVRSSCQRSTLVRTHMRPRGHANRNRAPNHATTTAEPHYGMVQQHPDVVGSLWVYTGCAIVISQWIGQRRRALLSVRSCGMRSGGLGLSVVFLAPINNVYL